MRNGVRAGGGNAGTGTSIKMRFLARPRGAALGGGLNQDGVAFDRRFKCNVQSRPVANGREQHAALGAKAIQYRPVLLGRNLRCGGIRDAGISVLSPEVGGELTGDAGG